MTNQWPGTTRQSSITDALDPHFSQVQGHNVAPPGDTLSQFNVAPPSIAMDPPPDFKAPAPQSLAERMEALQAPAPAGKPLPAQEGWRAGLSKLTGGLIKLAPGKVEAASREHVATIQRVFPRPVTIMVVNPGGGEGKSPTALALGATFGTRSEHAVLAWDNNETMGTLAALAQADGSTRTVTDLLEALPSLSHAGVRAGDVRAFTRHQGNSRFSVLASHHDPARMQMDWMRYWSMRAPNEKSIKAPQLELSTFNGAC